MTDLPILEELRADLVTAMRSAEAPHRPLRPARPMLLAALALALLTATAGAATYYALRASPIAPFDATDTTPEQRVQPGTSHVLELRSPDPDPGAPPWGLRLARSQTGLLCGTVGQIQGGEFGIVGLDGRFRPLPPANADACSAPDRDGLALLGARVFDADAPEDVRTVIYGDALGLKAASVVIGTSPAHQLPVAREGAFLWAVRGWPGNVTIHLRFASGRTRALRLTVRPPGAVAP
jgi:hypothetical protein